MKEKTKFLARCELFKTLPAEALEMVAERCEVVEAKAGQPFLVEGKPAAGLFVVVEGTVDYIKRMDDKNGLVLFRWEAGDAFGIGAVMEGREPFCSAVAQTDTKCLRLNAVDFVAICQASAVYEHRLFTQALLVQSGRLRQITLRLREFLSKMLK